MIPSLFAEVRSHLDAVQKDPSIPLDTTLLDRLKLQLTEDLDPVVPATLLAQIPRLLVVL